MPIIESKNKYRNMSRDRDAELAAEIAELEKTEGAPLDEETEKPVKPEDESWKKRYGDLRSHAQRQEDALKAKVSELEAKLQSVKEVKTPKSKEEVLDWKNKFPDVFDMVKTIAMEEAEEKVKETKQKYDDRFKELDEREHKIARQKAFAEVCEAHPDFPDLIEDQKFQDWIEDVKTPKWVHDALAVNDTDSSIAIDAVDLYKVKNKIIKKESKDDTRDAARTIKTPSRDAPSNDQTTWSESRVEKLSKREYEKFADEIDAAMLAGKFDYDISGAAR